MAYRLAPAEKLRAALFPAAPIASVQALNTFEPEMVAAGILTSKTRGALFLAHLAHECAGLTVKREDLYYTKPESLMKAWPRRFPTKEAAMPYLRNPKALAAKVYDGRLELGNTVPGDGYLFRGNGGLQITGRGAHQEVGDIAELDLVNHPELAHSTPDNLIRCAIAVWRWKSLNAQCDTPRPIENSTQKLNGGFNGLEDRRRKYLVARGLILG